LQSAGLVARQKRRGGTHRKKRERRPLPGMLLFQVGSTHRRIGALDHDLDLVVTLDDATGVIDSAIPVEQEGTMSSFRGLAGTIAGSGLFRAFYTDRGSRYFHPRKPGFPYAQARRQSRQDSADAGRPGALPVRHQPRGLLLPRDDRPHGAGIRHTPEPLAAGATIGRDRHGRDRHRYLGDLFAPDYNARLAVPPAEEGSQQRTCHALS
jgi:hypothetical protein